MTTDSDTELLADTLLARVRAVTEEVTGPNAYTFIIIIPAISSPLLLRIFTTTFFSIVSQNLFLNRLRGSPLLQADDWSHPQWRRIADT